MGATLAATNLTVMRNVGFGINAKEIEIIGGLVCGNDGSSTTPPPKGEIAGGAQGKKLVNVVEADECPD